MSALATISREACTQVWILDRVLHTGQSLPQTTRFQPKLAMQCFNIRAYRFGGGIALGAIGEDARDFACDIGQGGYLRDMVTPGVLSRCLQCLARRSGRG